MLKRRREFRQEIRKQDISKRITTYRQACLDNSNFKILRESIEEMFASHQPAPIIIQAMLNEMKICEQSSLPYVARLCTEYLTKHLINQIDESCRDLPELISLLVIELPQDENSVLANSVFISCLHKKLLELRNDNFDDGGVIFRTVRVLSSYAINQSNIEINLGPINIEELYQNVKNRDSKLDYQLLLIGLMYNRQMNLRSTKAKLKQLGNTIFMNIKDNVELGRDQLWCSLLIEIGISCGFKQQQKDKVLFLISKLQQYNSMNLLALIAQLIYNDVYLTYHDIREFLIKVGRFTPEMLVGRYLYIIQCAMVNQNVDIQLLQQIYIDIFSQKLGFFIQQHLIQEISKLLFYFINIKESYYLEQIIKAVSKVVRIGKYKIKEQIRNKLLTFLMIHNQIQDMDINQYCSLEETIQFWKNYQKHNQIQSYEEESYL